MAFHKVSLGWVSPPIANDWYTDNDSRSTHTSWLPGGTAKGAVGVASDATVRYFKVVAYQSTDANTALTMAKP